jgi:L-aminopeptidase/D-esterase-like protein
MDGAALLGSRDAMLAGQLPQNPLAGTNTTIGVVATDAVLTKVQAQRLAQVAHDGLARAINPVHTMLDGDTLFALGTGRSSKVANPLLLATLAAEVTARAVVNAVAAARGLTLGTQNWPAADDLSTSTQ